VPSLYPATSVTFGCLHRASAALRAIERRVDFGSLFGLPKFLCSDHSRDDNESCGANECGRLQSRMYYSAACLQTAVLEHSTFECLWANCAGRSHCSQGLLEERYKAADQSQGCRR
jgi:hypothetical protein